GAGGVESAAAARGSRHGDHPPRWRPDLVFDRRPVHSRGAGFGVVPDRGKRPAVTTTAPVVRCLDVGSASVAYCGSGGDGTPLLLLHGCSFSKFVWRTVIP